ncbi:TonB-dependent receptor plug domain-containing protein [Campylobacter fetus]|uniref:TonB-dependent receptor plug domain-containing protein n=1 Tax=Campylobacter fetus TaxID=196 RepID=UPI003AF942F5
MYKKITILLSLVLASSLYARTKLDDVIVSANRSAQKLDDISKSVSVIDGDTIKRRQSTNLTGIIADEPGISYAPDGMSSGQIILRGFSTQNFRAPLFVDGNRFRGRNTLEYMLFDPNQIERIEIIRGPASSLYGTDSFGGVVNVITKRATGDVQAPFNITDTYISSEYQSVNHAIANRFQLGGVGDGFDILLGINYKDGDNYGTKEGVIPNSDYLYRGFDLKVGYSFLDTNRVELTARYTKVNRGRAAGQFASPGAGNAPGVLQRQMREEPMREKYLALGYSAQMQNGSLEASLYRRELYTHINVIPNLNSPQKWVDNYVIGPVVYGGKSIVAYSGESLSQTYGIDWYYESRDGSEQSVNGKNRIKSAPNSTQLNIGVFGLLEYGFEGGTLLSASLRHDYFKTGLETSFIKNNEIKKLFESAGDTSTNKTTSGFGMIYPLFGGLDFVLNINSSFRAPSVTEITAVGDGVSGVFTLPNSSIKPETGLSYETGLKYKDGLIISNLTAFTSSYKNLIVTRNITYKNTPARQLQNVGESSISGIEFDIAYKLLSNLIFKTNASYLYGEDKTSHKPLPQIMPLNGFISLMYEPKSIKKSYIEYTTQWASNKTRTDNLSERERSGYAVSNLYFGKEFGNMGAFKSVELNFGIENIFYKKYSMPSVPEDIRYPVSKTNPLLNPGRNFKIGLRASF